MSVVIPCLEICSEQYKQVNLNTSVKVRKPASISWSLDHDIGHGVDHTDIASR
jgi:hypothetical protein